MPILHTFLDPEEAQKLAINLLSTGYMPKDMGVDDQLLATELFGRKLSNPIGLAAGFDKQAQAVDGLLDLGFGIVEVEPGNPQPRYFRLMADEGAINRFGFNSDGHAEVLSRLRERIRKWVFGVGSHNLPPPPSSLSRTASSEDTRTFFIVNLGKNKSSAENDNSDYIKGVETFGPYSDALVINVSSPNTPGLRSLQARANSVDAIIISNTTISRPENLISDPVITNEVGGLSGKPLKPLALNALRILHSELNDGVRNKAENKISLIGCGGIGSGKDALDFAKAGADVVELYTAFGYKGIGLPRRIKDELTILLKEEGKSWKDLVGTESRNRLEKILWKKMI
ncbi:hypothetical protein L7F22_032615 [Adiantum nelumboides]|nr:hypothetical protein [Adiantum nelumboides]